MHWCWIAKERDRYILLERINRTFSLLLPRLRSKRKTGNGLPEVLQCPQKPSKSSRISSQLPRHLQNTGKPLAPCCPASNVDRAVQSSVLGPVHQAFCQTKILIGVECLLDSTVGDGTLDGALDAEWSEVAIGTYTDVNIRFLHREWERCLALMPLRNVRTTLRGPVA